jgi:hypothetical protein
MQKEGKPEVHQLLLEWVGEQKIHGILNCQSRSLRTLHQPQEESSSKRDDE